jgi:hypothetical protein
MLPALTPLAVTSPMHPLELLANGARQVSQPGLFKHLGGTSHHLEPLTLMITLPLPLPTWPTRLSPLTLTPLTLTPLTLTPLTLTPLTLGLTGSEASNQSFDPLLSLLDRSSNLLLGTLLVGVGQFAALSLQLLKTLSQLANSILNPLPVTDPTSPTFSLPAGSLAIPATLPLFRPSTLTPLGTAPFTAFSLFGPFSRFAILRTLLLTHLPLAFTLLSRQWPGGHRHQHSQATRRQQHLGPTRHCCLS